MVSITQEETAVLRHSLGFNRTEEPSRNYYADEPDAPVCNALVKKGLMEVGKKIPGGFVYYHVTGGGIQALNGVTK